MVSVIIILSGIKDTESHLDVSQGGLIMMKVAMMIFPLICIFVSLVICRWKYKIDTKLYHRILEELAERGELDLKQ